MKFISLEDLPETGVSHNPEIRKQIILARGDVPHLTNFSQSVLLPGQSVSAHAHTDMHEIFFVVSGAGRVRIDGDGKPFGAGACIAVEPGETHEIFNTGDEELVLLYFGIET